ncbi:EamA family transporter [Moraxella oblonga]|uniref:EamA family transporter n=1 Tax=Moraxella oblonga TaxID=200413 RepID=UPI0008302D5A|nr:EamA family transporter [Moraxella oblonga]
MNLKDYLILSSVVLIWGVNFLAMKIGLNDLSPLVLGMVRFLLILFPAIFFFKKPHVAWQYLILYGLTISFGQFSLMFLALSWQFPTGLSALILQAQIFLTVLFAHLFLKEAVKPNHLIGMVCAGMGLVLIGVGQYQGSFSLVGMLPVLGASLSWALGNIIVKKIGQVNPLSLVIWGNISSLLAFGLFSLGIYGIGGVLTQLHNMSLHGVLAVLFLAYCASYIGYTGWGYLLTRHLASKVTPFIMLVPVIALVVGFLALKERLIIWHYMGIIMVLLGLGIHLMGGQLFYKRR